MSDILWITYGTVPRLHAKGNICLLSYVLSLFSIADFCHLKIVNLNFAGVSTLKVSGIVHTMTGYYSDSEVYHSDSEAYVQPYTTGMFQQVEQSYCGVCKKFLVRAWQFL